MMLSVFLILDEIRTYFLRFGSVTVRNTSVWGHPLLSVGTSILKLGLQPGLTGTEQLLGDSE